MSQVPTLAFDGGESGAEVLDDLGAAIEAIASMNGGDNPPAAASIRPYSFWFDSNDTSFGGTGLIKIANGDLSGWIPFLNVRGLGADGLEAISRNAVVVNVGETNTFTQPQLIVPASVLGSLTLGSQAGGGGVHGRLLFQARDDASADRAVAGLDADVVNSTAGAMAVQAVLRSMVAGTLADRFRVGNSLFAQGLSDTAAGSVNATELLRNGTALDAIIANADIRAVDAQSFGAGAAVDLDLAVNLHFLHTFTSARTLNFDNTTGKIGRTGILTLTASGADRTVTMADDNGIAIGGDVVTDQALLINSGATRKFIFLVRTASQVDLYEIAAGSGSSGFSEIAQWNITSGQSSDDFQRMTEIAEGETQFVTFHDIAQVNNNDSWVLIRVATDSTTYQSGYQNRNDQSNSLTSGIIVGRIGEVNDRMFGQMLIQRTNGTIWVQAGTMTSEYLSAGADMTHAIKAAGSYSGGQSFDRWYIDFTNSPNSIATGSRYSVRRNWA